MEWYEQPEPIAWTPVPYEEYEEFASWELEPVNDSIFHIAKVNYSISKLMEYQHSSSPSQIGMKRAGQRVQEIKRRKSS